MDKLIIFDLDGVLLDSKEIHFNSLNAALAKIDNKYIISKNEQIKIYEGLPTKTKLKLLSNYKNLSTEHYDQILYNKQQFTKTLLNEITIDQELVDMFKYIKSFGIKIAVASNSIRSTIIQCLANLEIYNFVDYIASNEDVKFPKPHPEIYWNVISHFGLLVEDVVIFEDSIVGRLSAHDSKAKLIEIKNRKDLSLDKINKAIEYLQSSKSSWSDNSLNILIPMAGAGSRFFDAGYAFPKPLIDVDGVPMIQTIVNNLSINAKYTYIVQKEHYEKYNLEYLLNIMTPDCNIVQVDGITDGAARTCLYASDFINNDNPLLIANSDQVLEWNSREFLYELYTKNADGGIATFKSSHPKWSYAKTNDDNIVLEVAEKKVISDNATVGVYYWKHGKDFVKYANQMIEKNIKTNNEFYVCPVFNEAIQDNKIIYSIPIKKMWGMGTPEDLTYYLYHRNKND